MNRRPPVMSKSLMIGNTERAASRIADLMRLAEAIETDADMVARYAAHECKACHYFSRIGGAAITHQPCMSCGKDQTYGSTNTDVLCLPCAQAGDLCKHCGGDISLRTRRRNWPAALCEQPT